MWHLTYCTLKLGYFLTFGFNFDLLLVELVAELEQEQVKERVGGDPHRLVARLQHREHRRGILAANNQRAHDLIAGVNIVNYDHPHNPSPSEMIFFPSVQ